MWTFKNIKIIQENFIFTFEDAMWSTILEVIYSRKPEITWCKKKENNNINVY